MADHRSKRDPQVGKLAAGAHGIATKEEDEKYSLSLGTIDVAKLHEEAKTFLMEHLPEKLHNFDERMKSFEGSEHRLVFLLEAGKAKIAKFGSLEAAQQAEREAAGWISMKGYQ